MTSLAIANSLNFIADKNGIQFNGELSYEEWNAIGEQIIPMAKSIGFMVGDWVNYGESRYGEKYKDAVRRSGLTKETLFQYAHVARRVQILERSKVLDFCHHIVLARLKDPEEQRHWIKIAEDEKMSVRRLKKSLNAGRIVTPEEMKEDPADRGYVTYLALLNRIRRWWARETQKAPVEDWDPERREGLKKDFKLINEIYESL